MAAADVSEQLDVISGPVLGRECDEERPLKRGCDSGEAIGCPCCERGLAGRTPFQIAASQDFPCCRAIHAPQGEVLAALSQSCGEVKPSLGCEALKERVALLGGGQFRRVLRG